MSDNLPDAGQPVSVPDFPLLPTSSSVPVGVALWFGAAGFTALGSVATLVLAVLTQCADVDLMCRVMNVSFVTATFVGFVFTAAFAVFGWSALNRVRALREEAYRR